MPLSPGDRLGPYEILSPLGAGGMGEVWKARDTRLDRTVAVKVLPKFIADRDDLRARFEREARAVSSLKHPNICVLFDIGKQDGIDFMVLEHLEGETLAARVSKGPLPLDQVLKYAIQIADALDRAHRSDVCHRDVKPANIMLTRDGVKVLDFGLAKTAPRVRSDDVTGVAQALTSEGTILGTPQYMAPEQYEGIEADARSDIFAFGCVVYEMVTGKRCFDGKTRASLIAAVLGGEPVPMSTLVPVTPPALERLVKRCLAKDPEDRYQSMRDVVLDLHLIGEVRESARADRKSAPLSWIAAGVFALVAAGLVVGFIAWRNVTAETRVVKFSAPPPEKGSFATGPNVAVSPDGRRVAFVAFTEGKPWMVWVRDLDSLAARPLPGTEGETGDPFWSPDSRFIAFMAGGKLKKIDVSGGPAVTLADAIGSVGGAWSRNDIILFAPNAQSTLLRVPAAGGSVTPVTTLDKGLSEHSHRWPWFLPDGHHFLYTAYNLQEEKSTVYLGDLDSKDDLKTRRWVLTADSNTLYAPPGYLLFMREQTLMAQPFDAGKALTTGHPVPIAEQVDYESSYSQGSFSSSLNGVLAYFSGTLAGNRQLTWFDRSGKPLGTVGNVGASRPAISPDGNTVAYTRPDPQTGTVDIWLHDLVRGGESRFTYNSKGNFYPVWSPDGNFIAFASNRDGVFLPYRKAVRGPSPEKALDTDRQNTLTEDWSRDGSYLIESKFDAKSRAGIWLLPLIPDKSDDRKALPYSHTEFNEWQARVSPNGRWLAYVSDETKKNEIYARTFPDPGGGKWPVSIDGGSEPVWSRDGKELYFIGPDGKMMVVEVKGGPNFQVSAPKPLFGGLQGASGYDVSKDGRFLVAAQVEQSSKGTMNVIVNWSAGLKK